MTSAGRQIVDPAATGDYHYVARCVQRAFLCGQDAYFGRDFAQRKAWVEARLMEPSQWFAVGLYACAVMSNHLHVVLHVDPSVALAWPPKEIGRPVL